jgi:hypothetical protein
MKLKSIRRKPTNSVESDLSSDSSEARFILARDQLMKEDHDRKRRSNLSSQWTEAMSKL